jgi:sortase A
MASKKSTQPQNRLSSWIRANPRQLGLALIVLAVLLFAFPKYFKSVLAPQFNRTAFPSARPGTSTGRPSGQLASTSASMADLGAIQIDSRLLSTKAPPTAPTRIVIPAVGIDLPIVEAQVTDGFWQTSDTSASHGVGSANAGEAGNDVIFAHARDGLFAPLRNIKDQSVVYLLTNNTWFRYQVTEINLVAPTQTEVIAPTPDETLTLYTCTGFLDSKRLIVVAKPLK